MMNTVRKSENLLPFPVISAAANGDTTAMCAILKHYEGYIAKLCTRTLKDDAGNTYSYVDEEMRNRLQVRLKSNHAKPVNNFVGVESKSIGSPSKLLIHIAPFNRAIASRAIYGGINPFFAEAWIACNSNSGSVSIGIGFSRSL